MIAIMEHADVARIQVNGELRDIHPGLTVTGLLETLDVRADRVAVEVNLHIVERQDFSGRVLEPGDRVEIISFIGGGTGPSPVNGRGMRSAYV
jgi:thiamine biosynthesis protein ThiS